MVVEKDKVVSVSYELKVEGELVDQTSEEKPLTFLFGAGQLIPGFEKNLKGKETGDQYAFTVDPEEGYGEVNPEAVVEVNKEMFVVEGELIKELQVGAVLPMRDQTGNTLHGKVLNIGLGKVKLDFNHPLAGKELNFSGKVTEVRQATADELEHSHAHGPDGNHH